MSKILEEHIGYLTDHVKIAQYQAAVDATVRPHHVVLDLGCGTGLLGLMALRAGAQKVLFVEHGAVLAAARRTIIDAGFEDKAEFYQRNSFELDLPEKVDVVICDHVGYFGFDYGILQLLTDAKQRFLKPDGIIIPARIDLKLAPVEAEECRKFVGQWRDKSVPEDFSWLGGIAANSKHMATLGKDETLADACTLTQFELGAVTEPFLSWSATFNCTRGGTLDGIAGWFECELADGATMTNSPLLTPRLDRPQAFFPLDEPVSVSAGDVINATVMVRHLESIIAWTVELPTLDRRFTHSTFEGIILDEDSLHRCETDRVAKLSDRGYARKVILSYCDGQRTAGEISELVRKDHANLFPTVQATEDFVTFALASDTSQ